MMKIGILTFHFAHNYGAMLQAYALTLYLNHKGYNAEIIDYRLPSLYCVNHERFNFIGLYKFYSLRHKKLYAIIKTILKYPLHRIRPKIWFRFENFLNDTLTKSNRIYNISDISKYDIYIFGSDQIWNGDITCGLQPIYFGYGLPTDTIKVAYAASNGNDYISPYYLEDFIAYIKNLDGISVREKGLAKFLSKYDIQASVTLDPSLLLNKDDWSELAINNKERDYILVYSFNEPDNFYQILDFLAIKFNRKVIFIGYEKNKRLNQRYEQITNCGPKEFLGYIKNASFIITNSFHGTAFSVLFEKQFISVCPKTGKERIISLLNLLGLNHLNINDIESAQKAIASSIDYSQVNERLKIERESANKFLTKYLNRVHK